MYSRPRASPKGSGLSTAGRPQRTAAAAAERDGIDGSLLGAAPVCCFNAQTGPSALAAGPAGWNIERAPPRANRFWPALWDGGVLRLCFGSLLYAVSSAGC